VVLMVVIVRRDEMRLVVEVKVKRAGRMTVI